MLCIKYIFNILTLNNILGFWILEKSYNRLHPPLVFLFWFNVSTQNHEQTNPAQTRLMPTPHVDISGKEDRFYTNWKQNKDKTPVTVTLAKWTESSLVPLLSCVCCPCMVNALTRETGYGSAAVSALKWSKIA